ncbi:MAG: RHS repeat-associated core domain-containing protein [Dissulfurispiraceae bacterium]|jgi:RHS repeat-associated protein|nr:RHS repeat-associated core domain-containing protein [Dissulfurispiraceae bacterium]
MERAGQLYYYHADGLGSVAAITDASGDKMLEFPDYKSFGLSATAMHSEFVQPYAFTSRELDQETGLYYYRNRYYDANTGRFISKDPIGFSAGDVNLYRYVGNNPVNWVDPEGLKTWMCEKPLDVICKLGMECSGTKNFADFFWNPLYHQYICVGNEKSPICGGQSSNGKPYGPGKPSNDKFSPDRCKEKEKDNDCIEACLMKKFGEPRPYYGIAGPFTTNCQEWADNAMVDCWRKCNGK